MIIKVFNQGQSTGNHIVKYLLSESDHIGYKPEVVEGCPELTKQIISTLDYKNKYITGVISFKVGENLSIEKQHELIESFQKTFAPFNDESRTNFLWVRHFDKGRLEIHFLMPRCCFMPDGGVRSFNLHPPGKANQLFFKSFVALNNKLYGFDQVDSKKMTSKQIDFYKSTLCDLFAKRKEYIYSNYNKTKIIKRKGVYVRRNEKYKCKYARFRNLINGFKSKIESSGKFHKSTISSNQRASKYAFCPTAGTTTIENFSKYVGSEVQAFVGRAGERQSTGIGYRSSTCSQKALNQSLSLQEQLRELGMQLNECETGEVSSITAQINLIKGLIEREQWNKPRFKR